MAEFTDTQLLDWLAQQEGVNLVSDDAGRWAVSSDGIQPVPPEGGFLDTVGITSVVEPDQWCATIRDALTAAMLEEDDSAD